MTILVVLNGSDSFFEPRKYFERKEDEAGAMNESSTAFARLGWPIRPASGSRKSARMNWPGPNHCP